MSDHANNQDAGCAGPVPQSKQLRDRIDHLCAEYHAGGNLPCNPDVGQLLGHCRRLLNADGIDAAFADFAAVCLNNHMWKDTFASIPFDKRLLLLPRCLRNSAKCTADFDEFGLICTGCGNCLISTVKNHAEKLGYAVLVAEGSPIVTSLISSGQVQAVIGVSCLSVLEKTFKHMNSAGIPGIAVPLLYDGCINTTFDADWLMKYLSIYNDQSVVVTSQQVYRFTCDFFSRDCLSIIWPGDSSQTSQVCLDWLAGGGKRFRPFLAVCVYQAVTSCRLDDIPESVKTAAAAVECFHKASLIHDDIEDGDQMRYGTETLHYSYGMPAALNFGDYLLGIGYRLLSGLDLSADVARRLLLAASDAHCRLSLGQGAELLWQQRKSPFSLREVVDIFRDKTSPAFEFSLMVGAILADCDNSVIAPLKAFSDSLGVAYQIADDIRDFDTDFEDFSFAAPSVILAVTYEDASASDRGILEAVWSDCNMTDSLRQRLSIMVEKNRSLDRARSLLAEYRGKALCCLEQLPGTLSVLLERITDKLLDCDKGIEFANEHKTDNDRPLSGGNSVA